MSGNKARENVNGKRGPAQGDLVEGVVTRAGETEASAETSAGTIRVSGGVPGDEAVFRITHRGKNAIFGTIARLARPSPQRVPFPCGNLDCGACAWRNWSIEGQREEKRRRIADVFSGRLDICIPNVEAAPEAFGFRNKLLLVAGGRRGRIRLGLYSARTRRLFDAARCPVQSPEGNRVARVAARILDENRCGPWIAGHDGEGIRFVQVRVAPGTGDIGVVFVTGTKNWDASGRVSEAIAAVDRVTTVAWSVNDSPSPVAGANTAERVAGAARLTARVGASRFLLGPFTFFQTNTEALPLLLDAVGGFLPGRASHLVDLYAGAGLFAISFADRAERVTAAESDPEAADCSRASAELNGAKNVTTLCSDAAAAFAAAGAADALIADPPRSGLPPAFFGMLRSGNRPQSIVHVSCSLKSLSRDLAGFEGCGYSPAGIRLIDMFPHTPHLETVTLLKPR